MNKNPVMLAAIALLSQGCGLGGDDDDGGPNSIIAVANRDDGTLSLIHAGTLQVVNTIPMPAAGNAPVLGYVAFSEVHDRLYIGDEGNHRIVVLNGTDLSHVVDMPVVSDVFHIWHNDVQLWAVDRTNLSVAVFDLTTNTPITTVPIPLDLVALGGEPHDVVVDADNAYVSILGITGAADVVVRYSTTTFTENGRATVGDDPHLFLHPTNQYLYVACQESDAVFLVDRNTMAVEDMITVDGGHGIWIPPHGQRLYVSNFAGHEVTPGGALGALALFAIDISTLTSNSTHAPSSAPHNIATNASGDRLFVTHSNGGTSVTVFDVQGGLAPPSGARTIQVGANPFGICRIR